MPNYTNFLLLITPPKIFLAFSLTHGNLLDIGIMYTQPTLTAGCGKNAKLGKIDPRFCHGLLSPAAGRQNIPIPKAILPRSEEGEVEGGGSSPNQSSS